MADAASAAGEVSNGPSFHCREPKFAVATRFPVRADLIGRKDIEGGEVMAQVREPQGSLCRAYLIRRRLQARGREQDSLPP
jgi:hypothetical protein